MLKFYTSPIGQSVGAKLPAVSEQMRKLMQQRMNEILPQIVAVRNDETERIVAAGPPAAAAGGPPSPRSRRC
jgi:hypothetical protein